MEAVIMPGVTIGDDAIIGAKSIVTKDIASYTIVVGNPARDIKKQCSKQQIESL